MKLNENEDINSPYLLFDYSPEAIIVTDQDFYIIYSNPIASNVFQLSAEELVGKKFSSILTPDEESAFYEKFHHRFNSNPSTVLVDITEGIKSNGKTFSTELFISRLKDKGNNYNIIFLRNLDIRKKYIDELRLLQILTADITNAATFHDAVEITIKNVCKNLHWDYGEAWRVAEDNLNFCYETGWSIENAGLKELAKKSSTMKIPFNDGLPHTISQGEVVWNSSISSYNSGFKRADMARDSKLKTCVGVPIKTDKELLACILFFSLEEKERDEKIISILSSLSNQLSILLKKKRAEEELKDREYFINQIAAISPNIISVHDIIHHKSLYTNKELTSTLGYSHEDLLKMGDNIMTQLVHPDDLHKVIDRNSKYHALGDDESTELEVRLITKDKKIRWINTRTKIFKRTEDGKPWITVSSAIDVTESVIDKIKLKEKGEALSTLNVTLEQKVEERTRELQKIATTLKDKEELLLIIANSLPAYISYIDKNLVYRFANSHYMNLDFITEDITGKHVKEAIIEKYYVRNIPYYERALEGKNSTFETAVTLKDGSQKYLNANFISDKNEEGEVRGIIILAIDMTDRIIYENKLNERNIQLKKINRDLDTFVYIASHDLKSPISNIQGLTKLIYDILKNENKLTSELDAILDMMKQSSDKFNKTIRSLTDVSRIQRNINEDVSELHLGDILKEVKSDLAKMIDETDALIKESIQSCSKIQFSRSNIKTIIYHLLLNSLQFRDPGRKLSVEISCEETQEYFLLKFADNGVGIKKENQEKIFQLFRRYNTTGQGTGTGLYIVRRIVEDNGGKIEVESEENKGSNFKIYLKKN